MAIKSALGRQLGTQFDAVFDVVKSNPIYDKSGGKIPSLDLNFAKSKSLRDSRSTENKITFSRASSATFVDGDGIIQSATTNIPRFDHDPATGESLGLLIEGARTNDITNNFSTGDTANDVVLSEVTSITNPDGTTGTIKVTTTAGPGQHAILKGASLETTNHSLSAFVKKGNHRYVGLTHGGAGNNIHCVFDFDTKTIIDDGGKGIHSLVSAGFEEYPNGWFRLHVIGFSNGSNLRVFLVEDGQQDGLQNWTASGSEFMYVWGPQKEQGSFPTSYIPTNGSTVTRAADIAEITGTNFSGFFNQTEGTVFAETSTPLETQTVDVQISDSTNNSKYELRSAGTSLTEAKPVIRVNGVTRFGAEATAGSGDFRKLILGYKKGSNAFACDGNIATSSVNFNKPSGINKLRIGDEYVNVNRGIGRIKRLIYFNTRLFNTILQTITA